VSRRGPLGASLSLGMLVAILPVIVLIAVSDGMVGLLILPTGARPARFAPAPVDVLWSVAAPSAAHSIASTHWLMVVTSTRPGSGAGDGPRLDLHAKRHWRAGRSHAEVIEGHRAATNGPAPAVSSAAQPAASSVI
jgi:hypothetical protein